MNAVEFLRLSRVLGLSCDVPSACPDYESAISIASAATIEFKSRFEQQCSETSRVLACWPWARWNEDHQDSKQTPNLRAEILTISPEEVIRVATSLLAGVAIEGTLSISDMHAEE